MLWVKRAAVTRETLAAAKARHHVPLSVRATVYRRWQPAARVGQPRSGAQIDIGSADDTLYLVPGWYFSEDIGGVQARWVGERPTSTLRIDLTPRQHVLRLRGLAYPAGQLLTVEVNGHAVASVPLAQTWTVYTVRVPAEHILAGEPTQLDLIHRSFSSPHDATNGQSPDKRTLAAAYDWLSVEPVR
jgi:hypothetical protein